MFVLYNSGTGAAFKGGNVLLGTILPKARIDEI